MSSSSSSNILESNKAINLKSPLAQFGIKALSFFVVWYLIYELWLLPDGRLDEWISINIVQNTVGILNFLGYEIFAFNRVVGIGEAAGIEVIDGCNGIAAIGLFLGFILAYPGDWKVKASFSLFGIAIIYLVNLFRIVILAITQVEWPAFFNFTHDYSTTFIFYVVIFFLWMLWAKTAEEAF